VRGVNQEDEVVEWYSEDVAQPTEEEIQQKIAELTADEPYRVLREIRDWYLEKSDWTQAQDVRAIRGAEWSAAWDGYRQALRDLPQNSSPYFDTNGNITGVDFPERPSA
jgi:hypothetical protein